jgi:quercetin dioxygenase-like cupin family protein
MLRQFQFGDPSNVVIVGGPPDFRIPSHASPYREIFLILAGSSVIELSDGSEQPLKAGSLVLMEDTSGAGHGGRFGPCGYVAVDLQYKVAAPAR